LSHATLVLKFSRPALFELLLEVDARLSIMAWAGFQMIFAIVVVVGKAGILGLVSDGAVATQDDMLV